MVQADPKALSNAARRMQQVNSLSNKMQQAMSTASMMRTETC